MDKIKYGVLDPYWSGEIKKDPWWLNRPLMVTFLLELAILALQKWAKENKAVLRLWCPMNDVIGHICTKLNIEIA